MNGLIDKRLVDEAVDGYVDWREERASVWDAYERWTSAHVVDSPLAFSAYQAALDREERAARVYAELMTRVAVAAARFQLDVADRKPARAYRLVAGMVAVVNSVVVGACAGLIAEILVTGSRKA